MLTNNARRLPVNMMASGTNRTRLAFVSTVSASMSPAPTQSTRDWDLTARSSSHMVNATTNASVAFSCRTPSCQT